MRKLVRVITILTVLACIAPLGSAFAQNAYYETDYTFIGQFEQLLILSEFTFERRAKNSGSEWLDRVLFAIDDKWETRKYESGKSEEPAELIGPAKGLKWEADSKGVELLLAKGEDSIKITTGKKLFSGSYSPRDGGIVEVTVYESLLEEGLLDIDKVKGKLIERRVIHHGAADGHHRYGAAFDRVVLQTEKGTLLGEGEFLEKGPTLAAMITSSNARTLKDLSIDRVRSDLSATTKRTYPSQWRVSAPSAKIDMELESVGNLFTPGRQHGKFIDLHGRSTLLPLAADAKFARIDAQKRGRPKINKEKRGVPLGYGEFRAD